MSEVAQGVYRVPARAANTYLVEAREGLVLVDTGLPGSEKRILKALDKLGRKPSELKMVLLTHRHIDHTGSAAALKRETGALLASHPFEKPYVAGTLVVSTPSAWSLTGRVTRRVLGFTMWTMKLLRLIKVQPVYVDRAADEESALDGTGLDGSILWTPGHTKGSVSLVLNQPKVAIVGDLVRSRRGRLVEPMLMESPPQTAASLQRLLELGPELICPGHGKPLPASAVELHQRALTQVVQREKKEEEDLDLDELASNLV